MNRTEFDYVAERKFARAQAARFLGRHAASLSAAYGIHILSNGQVELQGEPGSLQTLIERWQAAPVDREGRSIEFVEWACEVDGVVVRLIEEKAP